MKTSDKILAISAIFISACALAVSIYQTRMLSMEKDAAVWPYVRIATTWREKEFVLSVSNDGIGPAIIQNVVYTVNDSSYYLIHNLVQGLMKQDTLLNKGINRFSYANIEEQGTALKAGDSRDILTIKDVSPAVIKRFQYYIYTNPIKTKIDYCSIYQKCWRNQDNKIIEL